MIDYEEFCGINTADENEGELEIDVNEFKGIVESSNNITILDVREPGEYEICSLKDSRLIPLGDLTSRVHELDTADDIIVYCHHGMRSLQARMWF